ncbi:3-phosphoglycerate dehydrogenase [candidate division KSB3 bacterium]|uniref:D-3-phosphoglycerate dehydrogenase n=1 Tax=candidate division KSB3 bacterium TaxID=2044937 RepID=A0A2G6E9Q6_9BACT|nr:MAG: 3-phosphoglycerate dehydrogenase [candidate division KSB3 bacterium]PIE30871.1 MAG: 3-phosphoglycerate dehydrogenase [candidate division KSB3 bacterium]
MYKILKLNRISPKGLEIFPQDRYELASEFTHPDAILVRSHVIEPAEIRPSLKAIARAGAGVNTIPVALCTQRGIPVFNTPGANANAVKELVLAALVISSRGIMPGIDFVRTLREISDPDKISMLVERRKKEFTGQELAGKTLGVVGLGKIGALVAEMGLKLGMKVIGFDPELSVDAAWRLSNETERIENLPTLLGHADYISLHLPYTQATKNLINEENLRFLKQGARLLNFARGGIVNSAAVLSALNSGTLRSYASDFPTPDLLKRDDVILFPHIGAGTAEAEDSCAVMAATQLIDFLEKGSIVNSVNFPALVLERCSGSRIAIVNKNIPKMLGKMTTVLADSDINVNEMLNKSRDDIAYNLIDLDSAPSEELLSALRSIQGVINVRTVFSV